MKQMQNYITYRKIYKTFFGVSIAREALAMSHKFVFKCGTVLCKVWKLYININNSIAMLVTGALHLLCPNKRLNMIKYDEDVIRHKRSASVSSKHLYGI